MNARLLPWAAFAAIVAFLAFLAPALEEFAPAPSPARGTVSDVAGLEVRLSSVDLREYRNDGGWNRLEAAEAIYGYGGKTVEATGVAVSLSANKGLEGAVIRADRAFWDFPGKRIDLPDGGRADREGIWKAEFAPAVLDLDTRVLSVPGAVSLSGPGFSVAGGNLAWRWSDGKITLDSPVSRIAPASLPGKRG